MIDVVLPDPEDAEKELVFVGKIKSAKDGVVLITEPTRDGEAITYPSLPFEVTCRLPKDAFVWSFKSEITSVMGDTFVLTLPPADEIIREQRRSHVRASVNMKVQASVFMANRYFNEYTLEILDMSGGGCQVAGDRPFIPNTMMRFKIPLPGKVIEVHGKVVRANPFPQGTSKRVYTSGFAFTKLSEADREMLIKFIFEKMREDIKQGKVV
jgi:c-di-GMP-binding flagellar brake protein YcgR